MRTITGKLEGPQEIMGDVTLTGMITGDVLVRSGAHLDLNGMCCASLRVEPTGSVDLRGTVAGDVTNDGGDLHVYGVVAGKLVEHGGSTVVHPGAIVGGVRR